MQKLLYLCTVNLRRGLHVLSGGFADILKRRLLRSVLTGRNLANFELKNQDLATIDVLGMCISCTRVPFIWVYARICTYRRGLRVVGSIL